MIVTQQSDWNFDVEQRWDSIPGQVLFAANFNFDVTQASDWNFVLVQTDKGSYDPDSYSAAFFRYQPQGG